MFGSGCRTCCVITGASRGFGRAIALAVARECSNSGTESCFVLVSRSRDGLEETKKQMKQASPSQEVHTIIADLGEVSTLEETFNNILDKVSSSSVTHALLVNNAGSLGDLSKTWKDLSLDAETIQGYFDLNLTSPMFFISKFLQAFKQGSCTVVNVSSLMAVESYPYFSLYCTGKAARDMMCQVLAKEEPTVRVLNYAPGPLKTEMFDEISSTSGNLEIKQMFVASKAEGKVLSPDESARKLMCILKENNYASGAHVDYYD